MTTFKRVRRFGSWVTFLVLEAIALTLVVEYNQYQNQIFAHSANIFTGNLNEQSFSIRRYFSLNKENDRLQAENAKLRAKLSALQSVSTIADSIYQGPEGFSERFEFIPANIINKTLLGQNNYFTINLGKKDGIHKDMGVISDLGLVGTITKVSSHHATVMTLLHPQTKISASVKDPSNFGSLSWKGRDPYHMILEDIPKTVDVNADDIVVTSGYSNKFPKNIVIGTVDGTPVKTGEGSLIISVKLINELSRMTYVYVVKDHMASDLQQLEEP
jgi:rod shape-determining protein MreC